MKNVKTSILLFFGWLSLSLGIIGIILPILPTTPFLLLASACFLRSSKKLHSWMISHPLFGRHLQVYQRFHAISVHAKVLSLSLLWICITISILIVSFLWLKILLLIIGFGVSVFLIQHKTLTSEMIKAFEVEQLTIKSPTQN
jgi:uncharacterized membrane protein YbaN (DUF454 family)